MKLVKEAQAEVISGINKVADAVGSTLGPKACNVLITHGWGAPEVTHDGVTVAKNIILEDPFENAGAQMVIQAAATANDAAGDGTTTATILTQAIISEGLKAVSNGANAQVLKTELKELGTMICEELDRMAKPISTPKEIKQVATISSASETYGELIAEAMEKAGDDGSVTINEVPVDGITLEHTQGMKLKGGFLSMHFADEKGKAGMTDPYILLTDKTIADANDIIPIFEIVAKEKKPLVIIAENVTDDALALLVLNQDKVRSVALALPGFGKSRFELLKDLSVASSATVISSDLNMDLANTKLEDLGHAEGIISTIDNTLIIGGKSSDQLGSHIQSLKDQLKDADEFQKKELSDRIANITSSVVVINVGGKNDSEMKETKYRIEDAINATRAAQAEGIVAGGETALFKAFNQLELEDTFSSRILKEALKQPFLLLMNNAGITDGELIAKGLRSTDGYGINVMGEYYSDLIEEGIIDPVKVTKSALINAISVASLVLTTRYVIVEKPEVKQ